MKVTAWAARLTASLLVVGMAVAGAAAPASASTKIPAGYVLGSVEWCNFSAYKFADMPLTPGPGSLHLRARTNMSGGRDGVCAYVTDDVQGSHWINVRVRGYGWTASAWDANTYSTYAGAIGMHALPCFDIAQGSVTINGVAHTADYPFLWCS